MAEKESLSKYEKVPSKEVSDEKPNVPDSYGYGARHIQSLLLFFCVTIGYMARAHLGVSVVAMTRQDDKNNTNNLSVIDNSTIVYFNETDVKVNATSEIVNTNESIDEVTQPSFEGNESFAKLVSENEPADSLWNVYKTYEWTKSIQEMILSSFFLGYSVMMFPMGIIVQRYGGKIPLQIALLVNGVVSLVTPTVAVWGGWKAVCVCRILQGMSQSGLYPSVHTLLAKWVPIRERATLIGYVYTGTTLGTVISFQVGGLLADSAAGWPSTFWLIGGSCLVAFVLITVFAAATPAEHKTISDAEKNYIMGRIDDGTKMKPKTPWKQIFSSKPVWATLTTHLFCGICYVFLFTQIPTYMHYILGFDIKNSGLLSSLPYIGSFFCAIAYGVLCDYFINKGIVTLKTTRIVSNSLAQFAPAVCLVAVSFTDNSTLAVILLVAAVSLYAGVHTGWMVNYIDMSSNFSGALMALGNTGASAGVLSLPFLVSNIVTDVENRSQWQIMMFLMAGIIFFSNILYVCFTSTDKQPWDEIDERDDTEAEKVTTQ